MEPAFPPYTEEELQEFEDYYESLQPTSTASEYSYVPMSWSTTDMPVTTAPITSASATAAA
ncbi:hypothetical protein EDB81DRAFT_771873 [Dactylonectria macrodidyma]|uniref:Uncharacterized protein n=1 Tax=Dactylonectria macrodidyma TaxID=307937 RepID=A0A9P9FS48_9HYPO|nr:hypothetical protein EDB81DRAFT_771873 [Dactylonectria macrodidyma]